MPNSPVESRTEEEAAIVRTALDYLESWFDGDAPRIESALHPDLAKRSLARDGHSVDHVTTPQMVEATAQGLGKRRDVLDRRIDVNIDDIHGTIANVTVRSAVYREYLQLAHTTDGWKIVNALWRRTVPE